VAASKAKTKIKVGQWVFIGPGKHAIKAQVIEDRGLIGYRRQQVFLLLVPEEEAVVPGEEVPEAWTTVVAESRLIPA